MSDRLLKPEDVAAILQVSLSTAYRVCRELPGIHGHRMVRVRESAMWDGVDWPAQRPAATPAQGDLFGGAR